MNQVCRKLRLLVALPILTVAPFSAPASAYDWGPKGVPICGACDGDIPKLLPDGAGGAFVAYRDTGHYSLTNEDVYLQRITAAGQIAPGWPVDGLPVCAAPGDQAPSAIAPDGQGGVLVVWQDLRPSMTSIDIYAQRIRADGTLAPGWPVDGAPVSRGPGYESDPVIDNDGSGGAYVAWGNWMRLGYTGTAYVQHLDSAGQPVAGWPTNGVELTSVPSEAMNVVADGSDGAVVIWGQARGDSADVYATKVTPSGEIASGWPSEGAPIALGCGGRYALADGAGGFYTTCALVNLMGGTEYEYELHRWTFSGKRVDGWPSAGVRFPASALAPIKNDGSGGVLLGWAGAYATRVLSDALFAPGWPQDGVMAGQGGEVGIARDGSGGAYVVYTSSRSRIQHLAADGHIAPGWPANGVLVDSTSESDTRVVEDGRGGAIVVWRYGGLFAQHFSPEPPVPALPALASAEVTSDRVVLVWTAAGSPSATVYRRTDDTEWTTLGGRLVDGAGQLRYEDDDVAAGHRYAYRLGIQDGATELFTAETWVDVPRGFTLGLAGFKPHPADAVLQVAFTLASDSPAALDVFSVSGRRVVSWEVGSMGAGNHAVNLGREGMAPGVYWIKLTQGGHTLTKRGVATAR